jgi:hypothetical protein
MKDRLDPAPIGTVIEGFDPGDATDQSATTILEQAIQTAASSVEITHSASLGRQIQLSANDSNGSKTASALPPITVADRHDHLRPLGFCVRADPAADRAALLEPAFLSALDAAEAAPEDVVFDVLL